MRSRVWELNVIIAYCCFLWIRDDKGITECNLPASFFTVWVVWVSSFNPKNPGEKKAEATSIHSLGPETTIPISSPPKIDKESIVK